MNLIPQYGVGRGDVFLSAMPMAHSSGITFALAHLYMGGTVVVARDARASMLSELCVRERVDRALVVPTILVGLMNVPEGRSCLTMIRSLISTGAPLAAVLKRTLAERFPPLNLYEYYGATESPSMTILYPEDQVQRPGSVGRAFPNVEICLFDDEARECPVGQVGEVCVRNPGIMSGYLNRPEETVSAFRDGWYRTGDLGRFDEDGFLFIVGRKKDMIVSGGMNVYPAEIEAILSAHPAVVEAAVVGVNDSYWGEAVTAVVVARGDAEIDAEDLVQLCRENLASYKKPRHVLFVDRLPKNHAGKFVKPAIRKAAELSLSAHST